MGVSVLKTIIYTCDGKGCHAHGKGDRVPEGWITVQVLDPKDGKPTKRALFCPDCVARLLSAVHWLIYEKKPQEVKAA